MKKMYGRVLGVFLAAIMMCCSFGSVFVEAQTLSGANTTYTSVTALAEFCYQGYNEGVEGPITMVPATLHTNGTDTKVYLIGLSGTEFVENQSTGAWTDFLAGFELNNNYLKAVVNVVTSQVPAGSNLVFCGHSLGGMIAQQCAANSTLKSNYTILNTVTFGAPLISGYTREGTVKRLGDTSDVVPYLSLSSINGAVIWQYAGLNKEDGGFGGVSNCVDAHINSYKQDATWGAYDVVGSKNGGAAITFNNSKKTSYYAPTDVSQ